MRELAAPAPRPHQRVGLRRRRRLRLPGQPQHGRVGARRARPGVPDDVLPGAPAGGRRRPRPAGDPRRRRPPDPAHGGRASGCSTAMAPARRRTSTPTRALPAHAAEQGSVLLKNRGGTLPLDTAQLRSLAVIGPRADQAFTGGGGSSHVTPTRTVDPVTGLRQRLGSGGDVTFTKAGTHERRPGDPRLGAQRPEGRVLRRRRRSTGTPALTRDDPNVDFDCGAGSPAPGLPRRPLLGPLDRHPHPRRHRLLHLLGDQRRRQPAVPRRPADRRQLAATTRRRRTETGPVQLDRRAQPQHRRWSTTRTAAAPGRPWAGQPPGGPSTLTVAGRRRRPSAPTWPWSFAGDSSSRGLRPAPTSPCPATRTR